MTPDYSRSTVCPGCARPMHKKLLSRGNNASCPYTLAIYAKLKRLKKLRTRVATNNSGSCWHLRPFLKRTPSLLDVEGTLRLRCGLHSWGFMKDGLVIHKPRYLDRLLPTGCSSVGSTEYMSSSCGPPRTADANARQLLVH